MIGWYVHHVGAGHLHRARAVAAVLDEPVTILSSLPRPSDWSGGWVSLARDDSSAAPRDPSAHGRLHWVPVSDPGLSSRMALVSAWLESSRPSLLVSDVSVEVALLARLHGVPVVCVTMPGDRTDAAHALAYDVADAVVGCWPAAADGIARLPASLDPSRVHAVGGLSRHPVAPAAPRRPGPPRVAVLMGAGGHDVTAADLAAARSQTPEWEWTALGGGLGSWVADPAMVLREADVVVTHAGQNAVAEVAAARRPAVVIPGERPHDEQRSTGRVLASGSWPAVVRSSWPSAGWSSLLDSARALDGSAWAPWCDGLAASRFAAVLADVAGRRTAVA